MRSKLIITFVAVAFLLFGRGGFAAEKSDATTELKALISKIQAKLGEDKKTEKELAAEIKEFDALIAKHKGEKTDEVAQIVLMKAVLYLQVFDDLEKGAILVKQVKADFPGSKPAQAADDVFAQAEGKRIQRSLVEGAKFPDFDEKDVAGKPLSIANYKGKVVLIDFWATWCGPCIRELPNVLKAYEKYHAQGFEIIGISLDKEEATLTSFTKKRNMPWQQFFDGKFWGNKLAVRYGIQSIPATFLLDGEGKIIGKDLGGQDLADAVGKALAKK